MAHPLRLRTIAALGCAAALTTAGASSAQAGTTYLPLELAKLTNEKYGKDCFWAPPKGMDYARLPNTLPIQTPNLYPDVGSTYFVGQYVLPAGATLTFRGRFPHERYFSYTIFKSLTGGQIGPGDRLRDEHIVPDEGSVNPFVATNRRDAKRRNYTVHVVGGPIPERRAQNALYTGSTDPNQRVGMSMRNYLPDKGLDGTGGVGLPKLTLTLADGTELQGEAACALLDPIEDKSTATFPMEQWKSLVAASPDPANMPAVKTPVWQRFWNAAYSVAGAFILDPAERAKVFEPKDEGGFQSNPDTRYMTLPVSLNFGKVITVSGKLPTFPRTLPASKTWKPKNWQVRYWSLCTGSSPVSGKGFDCVYDAQVPLGRDRSYTLVVSRPEDRPRNARPACGYRWLAFGNGEDYPDPAARDWVDTLYVRYMAPGPTFTHAPVNVKTPGTEAQVMGPYMPKSKYWSKAEFEKRGCKR